MTMIRDDDELWDRLVDDELSEVQRARLISQCEAEPGAWRRCALALLEAQTWRRQMKQFIGPADSKLTPSATPRTDPASARPRRRFAQWFGSQRWALAASMLVACSLGWTAARLSLHRADVPQGAGGPVGSVDALTTPTLADNGTLSITDDAGDAAWRKVQLVVDDGSGASSTLEVPVVEADSFDPEWLVNRPPPLPAEVIRGLRQLGNDVRVERQFLPFNAPDGRQMIIPMDRVEVQPVSNYYQ